MINVLRILLMFCDGSNYPYVCEEKMKNCFAREIAQGQGSELAFEICLDENYRYTAGGDAWDWNN